MRSWKVGRAFGINLYVHWTFLFLVAFVLCQNWSVGGEELAFYGGLALVGTITCVACHWWQQEDRHETALAIRSRLVPVWWHGTQRSRTA